MIFWSCDLCGKEFYSSKKWEGECPECENEEILAKGGVLA